MLTPEILSCSVVIFVTLLATLFAVCDRTVAEEV